MPRETSTDRPKERHNFTLAADAAQLLDKLAKKRKTSRSAMLEELIRLRAAQEGVRT